MDFRIVATGLKFPEGPLELPNGDILVTEIAAGCLTRVRPSGEKSLFATTGGGPNGATDVLATYMYKRGFVEFNMGYASAVAAFMLAVSLVIIVLFRGVTTQRGEGAAA